jgi:surfactin family lipopeptide synthetase C
MMSRPPQESDGDLAERIAALSPAKRALLERKLRSQRREGDQGQVLKRSAGGGPVPLSFAQESLWIAEQLNPGTSIYNRPVVFLVKGLLDVGVLERALDEMILRHEALRMAFFSTERGTYQAPQAVWRLSLPVIELSVPPAERERLALQLATAMVRLPFDLRQGAVIRAMLLRYTPEEHLLVLSMHHLVSDGGSDRIFLQELIHLYEAYANDRTPQLPALPIQYTDYVIWQRQVWQGKLGEAALAYWKRQLAGLSEPVELPTDRPRLPVQTFQGGLYAFTFARELSAASKAFSRAEGITFSILMLAAFLLFLYDCTGQTKLVVSTPLSGRSRVEFEHLIGLFVNTLLLHIDLTDEPDFRELLRRVHISTFEAFQHQDVPIEKILENIRLHRTPGGFSLTRVGFTFQTAFDGRIEQPSLSFLPICIDPGTAKIDLTLYVRDRGSEGVEGSFEYNNDLFEVATIQRWSARLQQLLALALAHPEWPVSTLLVSGTRPARLLDLYLASNLTKSQVLIWLSQKLQPAMPLYNIAMVFDFPLAIDPTHFQRAFRTVINSSDAFRTVIFERAGVPRQELLPRFDECLEYRDYSLAQHPVEEAMQLVRKRCQQPFDMEKRLFDALLIKVDQCRFFWYICYHHMISDGFSSYILFQQLAKLYARALCGSLPERVELPPFKDYCDFERSQYGTERYKKAQEYWRQKLAPEREPLTFYGTRAAAAAGSIKRVVYPLGPERTKRLKRMAMRRDLATATLDLSLLTLFLAAMCIYLQRQGGQRSVVIGVPFHNRRTKAFKATLGLFMEVLPLCIEVQPEDTFSELVNKVKKELFDILMHSRYTISPHMQNKLYDVLMNYQAFGATDFLGSPFAVEWLHPGYGNDSLAIQVHDFVRAESIVLNFDFHTTVFTDEQQERVVQHFVQIVDQIIDRLQDNSKLFVHEVDVLTAQEKRLLVEVNQTRRSVVPDMTVHRWIDEQARLTPDRVAVVSDGLMLTYGELVRRANQLAHCLARYGVGPEYYVGIALDRSPELIISVLAVLKAGGAYVPLDQVGSAERLRFVLREAQVTVLITKEGFVCDGADLSLPCLRLDTDWQLIEQQEESAPISAVTTANLAYVIYTSGSTGRPKGCMITHGNLLHSYWAWAEAYDLLSEPTCHLQMASFSFDVFAADFMRALGSGGRLVLVQREYLVDARRLYSIIREEGVTHAEFVPTVLRLLLRYLEGQTIDDSLRVVVVGSESWSGDDFARLRECWGKPVRCINSYGVTEATIDTTYYEEQAGDCPRSRQVIIGGPFRGSQVYVLDAYLQQVPIGVPAELYIGGAGVGRGYVQRPALTAERFLPNPYSEEPGARLYRTGDRVRFLPDGHIEYLGRVDQQVKLRGFRIELGEIEGQLRQYPGIRDAVVISRADVEGDQQLIAYVTFLPEVPTPSLSALFAFLKGSLPSYMVPAALVPLDELPRLASGKVDRGRLPPPTSQLPLQTGQPFRAPETEAERLIASVWAEVLQRERVGVDENFFDLGGHSVLLLRVYNRLRDLFQKDFPVVDLFRYTTISALADYLSGSRESSGSPEPFEELEDRLRDGKERLKRLKRRYQAKQDL